VHGARLVVGLGNPGREYAGHRHNVGVVVLDRLAAAVGIPLGQSKFQGRFGQGDVGRLRVLLLAPETFMNASGESVSAAARFFKVAPEDLLVLHDFSSEEKAALEPLLERSVDMARAWVSLGLAEAMNRHNRR